MQLAGSPRRFEPANCMGTAQCGTFEESVWADGEQIHIFPRSFPKTCDSARFMLKLPFNQLGLPDDLLKAVASAGYEEASPIQTAAIPVLLQGRDVVGQSA